MALGLLQQSKSTTSVAPSMAPSDAGSSLSGHAGHLDAHQSIALEEYRQNLIDTGLYTPEKGDQKASHSEATLLRFLRARKFDPKATQQFKDAEKWRQANDVDNLYRNFDVEEFETAKKYYPTFTGRRDKLGLPVYVYRLSDLNSKLQKELASVPVERRYQRIVALYEFMMKGVLNLSAGLAKQESQERGTPILPITSVTTIVDLGGVSLSQLWNVRSHLQQASTLANANYPETLNSILVVNAPSSFPTVWGWIKGWFDPSTRDKINVLGNPAKDTKTRETLKSHIDEVNLPTMYGGTLQWQTGDKPNFDEPARKWLTEALGSVDAFRGPQEIDPDMAIGDTASDGGDSGVGLEDDRHKPRISRPPQVPATVSVGA